MKRYISDIILYLCLGCFSYFVLVNYADIPIRSREQLITFKAFSTVAFIFCGVGLSIRLVYGKMMSFYQYFLKDKRALSIAMIICAIILLAVNYLMLVTSKYMVGVTNPFNLQQNGITIILGVWLIEIIIVGQFMQNTFYADLVRLYKRAEELEKANAQAKYQALQSQLNPHFLFNNLNTLISEIEYSPENAIEFTRNLADTYRYILISQSKNTVKLSEELEFIDKYIQLHKVRLGDCIEITNSLDESFADTSVPPLTMQLLIENVIKHNVISISKPMNISIYSERNGKSSFICISNPVRKKQNAASSGKGLENLLQRYRMICGKDIIIEDENNIFTVKLPLIYE